MKAESTIRKTMNALYKIGRECDSKEQGFVAYDMATALQWVLGNTSWNPISLCNKDKEDENGEENNNNNL